MDRDKLAIGICIFALLAIYLLLLYFMKRWQKAHSCYLIMYHQFPSVDSEVSFVLYKSRSDVDHFLETLKSLGDDVRLIGVYSFVPSDCYSFYGGSAPSSLKFRSKKG